MNKTAPLWPLLCLLLLFQQPALAWPPEQDLVAVQSTRSGDTLPGQLLGGELFQALQDALVLVGGDEPDAARPGLAALARRLNRLRAGLGHAPALPPGYRSGGQLWLPVRVERLRARLDAPEVLVRPPRQAGKGEAGNLPVRARRITWLPVADTARRVARALPLLAAGEPGRKRAEYQLEQALGGVRTRVTLEDRPVIVAYYRVAEALAAAPHGNPVLRARLATAANGLAANPSDRALARSIRTQADSPSVRTLRALALTLRKRIVQAADDNAAGSGS